MSSKHNRGFTLVELLVVIAIIGVLVGLLLPAVQAAREAARRTQCKNNVKQIGLAGQNYAGAQGEFPPAAGRLDPTATNTRAEWGYLVRLLPYMEKANLYESIDPKKNWYQQPNQTLFETELTAVKCPSFGFIQPVNAFGPGVSPPDGGPANRDSFLASHYLGILGANLQYYTGTDLIDFCDDPTSPYTMQTISEMNQSCRVASAGRTATNGVIIRDGGVTFGRINDGTSNTFLAGEAAFGDPNLQKTRPWFIGVAGTHFYTARNAATALNSFVIGQMVRNDVSFGSSHPGGCHFAMCDGSVQFLDENMDLNVLYAYASRDAGELNIDN